jgi:TonB-dependent starch-binding outer membrane protein SusC
LLSFPIPATSGYISSLNKLSDNRKSGFEFVIDSKNLIEEFSKSSSVNLAGVEMNSPRWGTGFYYPGRNVVLCDFTIFRVGDPVNSYYSYKTAGAF